MLRAGLSQTCRIALASREATVQERPRWLLLSVLGKSASTK